MRFIVAFTACWKRWTNYCQVPTIWNSVMSDCNTWLTSRPAALLCKLTAALESWPVSCASTYCLEILSPKSTLSLQPPHNQPRPPAHKIWKTRSPSRKYQSLCRFYMHSRAQAIKAKMIFWVIYVFLMGTSPIFPFLERSQPQLSRSPRLQFLVRVYMTPAALIAWTKEVSLVAVSERKSRFIYLM